MPSKTHAPSLPSVHLALAAAGLLLVGLNPGRALAQGAPVLTGVTAKADAQGRPALLFSFDRPPPLFSVIGDGSDQPAVAFAGAIEAPGLLPPAELKGAATAMTLQPGDGVLSVRLQETASTHLAAEPEGDRAVLVTVGGAAAGVAASPDRPPVRLDPNEDGFEVVALKYADVSEIVGLLTGEQGVRPNDNFTPQEPAFGSATMSNASTPPPPAMATGAVPLGADAGPQMIGQSIDPAVGIDRRLNAIILRGPPDLIARMKAKIAKLDQPVTSVLLETVFVELTDTGAKNVGLNLDNADNQIASAAYNVGGSVNGALKSYATATLQAAIYAQVQKGEGKIVSKPRISAQSGASAKIITGDAVPILTSIALSGVNAVSQQVQYVTVGVTLQIAPRVTDDGFVTSHVFCEVSSVTGSSQGYPTISQREATTSATVGDGQSFVIGGLTQENAQSTASKVPGLGDIPGLGQLLNLHQSTRSKTDLYIVVTPHIMRPGEARGAPSAFVRSALNE